jgi:hypothetical protein
MFHLRNVITRLRRVMKNIVMVHIYALWYKEQKYKPETENHVN